MFARRVLGKGIEQLIKEQTPQKAAIKKAKNFTVPALNSAGSVIDVELRETTLLFEKTRHFDIIPARHCAKIFRKD